jgi:DNA modification methylase
MAAPRTPAIKNVDQPLSIVYCEIEKLEADSSNPRRHSKRQIQQIARSIEAFGFNVPFLVDDKVRVIAGHGRLAACKLLGIKQVPTIRLEHLTENQIRAFMVADNRLTENATWDDRLLAEQIKTLSEVELDFNLEATGFEMGEIDVMIEGLATPTEADGADIQPEAKPGAQVAKAGDIWLLGRNRLICGDALDEQTYSLLMDGKHAAAVFVDPPYNDPIDKYVTGFGKVHHAEFAMASGEMTEAEFTEFLAKALSRIAAVSVSGSLHFVCMDWRHIKNLLDASEHVYSELKNVCVWVKDTGGQGSLYRSQHELVFVFKSGKHKHRNNIQLGQFGRYRTNVWQHPRVNSLSAKDGKEEGLLQLHPTVKPVALVAEALMDCTARNEIVLDAFAGSGTTLIAAERTGRIGYGIELDPSYVDLAIRRWQTFTGQVAVHAASGQSFKRMEEVLHG